MKKILKFKFLSAFFFIFYDSFAVIGDNIDAGLVTTDPRFETVYNYIKAEPGSKEKHLNALKEELKKAPEFSIEAYHILDFHGYAKEFLEFYLTALAKFDNPWTLPKTIGNNEAFVNGDRDALESLLLSQPYTFTPAVFEALICLLFRHNELSELYIFMDPLPEHKEAYLKILRAKLEELIPTQPALAIEAYHIFDPYGRDNKILELYLTTLEKLNEEGIKTMSACRAGLYGDKILPREYEIASKLVSGNLKTLKCLIRPRSSAFTPAVFEAIICLLLKSNELREVYHFMDDQPQHKEAYLNALKAKLKELIPTKPAEFALEAYILFGDEFQGEFLEALTKIQPIAQSTRRMIEKFEQTYGLLNVRKQHIIEALRHNGLYRDLFIKTKQNYHFNPKVLDIAFGGRDFHFIPNSKSLFKHQQTEYNALASLDDCVEIFSYKNLILDTSARNCLEPYFKKPYTESSMMVQSMVKRWKEMGEQGCDRFAGFIENLKQCDGGQQYAIRRTYDQESSLLPLVELKHVTTWLIRLQKKDPVYLSDEELRESFKMSRAELIVMINHMLQKVHTFRQHLTDLQNDNAYLLKALLRSIVNLESDLPIEFCLKQALLILKDLSVSETFDAQLKKNCKIYGIAKPANKFGTILTKENIESLIGSLKEEDCAGRVESVEFAQAELRAFVQDENFQTCLNDFESQSGIHLRLLLEGYIQNKWPIALLNLAQSAKEVGLEESIRITYERTRIDNDFDMSWDNLREILLKESLKVKEKSVEEFMNEILPQVHGYEQPHSPLYLLELLGGVIGLRSATDLPKFDSNLSAVRDILRRLTLQEAIDGFSRHFSPQVLIHMLKDMLNKGALQVPHKSDGGNAAWYLVAQVATFYLKERGYDNDVIQPFLDALANLEEEAVQFALAILLTKIELLEEISWDAAERLKAALRRTEVPAPAIRASSSETEGVAPWIIIGGWNGGDR